MHLLGGPCRVSTASGDWPELNNGLTYTDRVQGGCGLTLLQFYATKHASSASIEHWRQSILAGQHSINGQVCKDPTATVPPNALLEHRRPGWAEPPAPAFLDVLWWDAHLVAVHKPSGLQVLPAGPIHERCALTLLRRFHQQHADQLEGMPAPVHRLGRGTSGVLICACSEEARRRLSRDFAEHGAANNGRMRKVYRTLVAGLVAQDEGEIDVAIGKIEYPGVRGGLFAARPEGGPGAKPSRSHYTVLQRNAAEGTTLVDVEIFTGRPHQIRIHMAALGHPLAGDPLYAPGGLPLPLPALEADAQQQQTEGKPGAATEAAEAAAVSAEAPAAATEAAAVPLAAAAAGAAAVRGAAAAEAAAPPGTAAEAAAAAAADLGSWQAPREGGCTAARPRVVMPGDCGYLLHSRVLEFDHPVTGERVVATCPPPPALQLPQERGAVSSTAAAGSAPA